MSTPTSAPAATATKLVLVIMALAQFLMVIDTTVMNVSISYLVHDLDTTVTAVQSAITLYTLVMATTMIIGGKLGDVWGRRRAFRIGLVVYAMGSGITSISQGIGMLYFGWSLLEGLGAALIMPAIAALIAANFTGAKRASAYGVIAAAGAAACALGPIIGGFVTTEFSWRYVFISESVLCIGMLFFTGSIKDADVDERPKLDLVGGAMAGLGLGLIVFGVLKSSTWGWVTPQSSPSRNGSVIAPLGISLVLWMILSGFLVLWSFMRWLDHREATGRSTLVSPELFKNRQLVGGLITITFQNLIQMGMFFAVPLFLSIVLGLSAFETGIALVPLSFALVIAAMGAPRLAPKASPRLVCRIGLFAMFLAAMGTQGSIEAGATAATLVVPLLAMGFGIGLLASQVGNVVVSSVPIEKSSEAGGLQYTAQNLGASLGTAFVGAVLIAGLATSLASGVTQSTVLNDQVKSQSELVIDEGVAFQSDAQLEASLAKTTLSPADQQEIVRINAAARIDALRKAMAAVALFAVIALFFTGRLPGESLVVAAEGEGDPEAGAEPATATTG